MRRRVRIWGGTAWAMTSSSFGKRNDDSRIDLKYLGPLCETIRGLRPDFSISHLTLERDVSRPFYLAKSPSNRLQFVRANGFRCQVEKYSVYALSPAILLMDANTELKR